jgi:hypothetical protein
MMTKLSTVEYAFSAGSVGCVIDPGIPVERKNLKIKVGEPIELRRPDGTVLQTKIAGLVTLCRTPRPPPIPIALPMEVRKEDVPIGTEVWIDMEGREYWPTTDGSVCP